MDVAPRHVELFEMNDIVAHVLAASTQVPMQKNNMWHSFAEVLPAPIIMNAESVWYGGELVLLVAATTVVAPIRRLPSQADRGWATLRIALQSRGKVS